MELTILNTPCTKTSTESLEI